MRQDNRKPHVVILGAGFGGMEVSKQLAREPCRITLVDQWNHHVFQPLLYQVATGGLSVTDIAAPLRSVFRKRSNVEIRKETVRSIDLDQKTVATDRESIGYDYLVLALGAKTAFFGHEDWAQHTLQLKSLRDAVAIRRRVFNAFEEAEIATDPAQVRKLMTIVIVVGGPTGVELAGAIAELKERVFRGNFRHINTREARIVLVEAQERLLSNYDEPQSDYARRRLETMGVEVRLITRVEAVEEGAVIFGGSRIEAATVIWVAGVEAQSVSRSVGLETDRAGRIPVEKDLSLPGHPEAFAVGDIAKVQDESGNLVPGVAPAATQMGRYVASLLRDDWRGRPLSERRAFRYRNKGDMATIGRSAAIANIGGWKTKGLLAWLLWLFIHLMYLVGFRNRVMVFVNWVYAYFTYDRGARIVIDEESAT